MIAVLSLYTPHLVLISCSGTRHILLCTFYAPPMHLGKWDVLTCEKVHAAWAESGNCFVAIDAASNAVAMMDPRPRPGRDANLSFQDVRQPGN
jgi:hypothetical protein